VKVGNAHLTYCTNIHAGESWAEVRANLERHVVAVKALVAPHEPFGVGLRLSARAARELAPQLTELRRFLDSHDLYVFTINGFPYGAFHGTPVKADVYRPDWLEEERVTYTNLLADTLAALLPDGVTGTISTVPGCFRSRGPAGEVIARNLMRCGDHLAMTHERTGKHIMLALEPEPCCALETIDETIRFFTAFVPDRRHLSLCLDACHAAVEFEDLSAVLGAVRAA
jgi:sugar phosphate isomerase/epimerase